MRRLLVLGAGTAGTMVVNRLRRRLGDEWTVTVVDRSDRHIYQPGLVFLPFGPHTLRQVVRPRRPTLTAGVDLVYGDVDRVLADQNQVLLADGRRLRYDYLVIATGVQPRPQHTPGMLDGGQWRRSIFDFYTYDGATALRRALWGFTGGRLVVHVTDAPVKGPAAPLQLTLLVEAYLRSRGMRDQVELVYATPLPAVSTSPVAARHLGALLDERKVAVETGLLVERVDDRTLVGRDGREVPFDLLVTVPLNMGADLVARSGLGDGRNLVPVDRHTLLSRAYPNIFALGDANDLPAAKTVPAARLAAEVLAGNLPRYARGEPATGSFDSRASLLEEARTSHRGGPALRWAYWNLLLPGRRVRPPAWMSDTRKHA
ncbi:MAG TPA: FAD-dependent oxidoreductase [Micromonosporaceae bacterium]|nr:FAD-dependent oxidoreductase [Micromonosporaceae bacterium]